MQTHTLPKSALASPVRNSVNHLKRNSLSMFLIIEVTHIKNHRCWRTNTGTNSLFSEMCDPSVLWDLRFKCESAAACICSSACDDIQNLFNRPVSEHVIQNKRRPYFIPLVSDTCFLKCSNAGKHDIKNNNSSCTAYTWHASHSSTQSSNTNTPTQFGGSISRLFSSFTSHLQTPEGFKIFDYQYLCFYVFCWEWWGRSLDLKLYL